MNKILIRNRKSWDLGTWIWLLNRIAGVTILVYLVTHIIVIGIGQNGPEAFNEIMEKLHNPATLFLELLLVMAVLAHGLNGLRHILIDFALVVPGRHKFLLFLAAGAGAVLFVVAGNVIWPALTGGS